MKPQSVFQTETSDSQTISKTKIPLLSLSLSRTDLASLRLWRTGEPGRERARKLLWQLTYIISTTKQR